MPRLPVLFNSLEFLVFFPIVVGGYFLLPRRARWGLLLVASYTFYAAWRVEYLALLVASTVVDYIVGLRMGRLPGKKGRGRYLVASIVVNLGLLFTFKYAGFANESLRAICGFLGIPYDAPTLELLLPVGISFYTFQTLSYTIDVYRGRQAPERNLGIFALYVSFFPQLVAGPIERSHQLLPQLRETQEFDWERVKGGLLLMLWGFFKKLVIADRLAAYVDLIYTDPGGASGLSVALATAAFVYQLYCDFSGYTDIALGAAQVMGIRLSENFRRPFAARDLREFWQRWHITLTRWVVDYLYVPLARGVGKGLRRAPVVLFVFLLMGLWHGAGSNFALFGLYTGVVFLVSYVRRRYGWRLRDLLARPEFAERPVVRAFLPLHRGLQRAGIYLLFCGACIFFRSRTLAEVGAIVRRLWSEGLTGGVFPESFRYTGTGTYELIVAGVAIVIVEAVQWARERWSLRPWLSSRPMWLRWGLYYLLIFAILMFGEFNLKPFIYFRF